MLLKSHFRLCFLTKASLIAFGAAALVGGVVPVFAPVFANDATKNDLEVYRLQANPWGTDSSARRDPRLAQLIVPQQPAQENTEPLRLQDFETDTTQRVILKSIQIEGNQRVSDERVRGFFAVKTGEIIDSSSLNTGLRQLYRSGLFKDFRADLKENGDLVIVVTENPIINRVAFEGNKVMKDEVLETTINSRVRLTYSVSRIDEDVRKIQTAYRQSGRFAAIVKPVIIKRPQNRVDIVFEITEGDKTLVESINFIGNKFASDRELRDEMFTKTHNFFSILFGGDTFDPDKLNFDAENIRNFYLRHGYADFRVLSTNSELDAGEKGFHITISLEEGKPYDFGEFSVESSIPELDTEVLRSAIPFATNDRFNNQLVQEAIVRIENTAQSLGIPFVRAVPQIRKNSEEQKVDLIFSVQPGLKRYVETININGNVRTLDYVIRRELEIDEGDPISTEKIALSEANLYDLGFFKSVEIIQRQGTNANDVILDVQVQEKSTGSFGVGLGVSTSDGVFSELRLSEDNFLGKGQSLAVSAAFGKKKRDYNLSFTEPRFLERDLGASMNIFRQTDDGSSSRKFSYTNTGAGVSFDQELYRGLSSSTGLKISRTKINNVQDTASEITKSQAGSVNKFTVIQSLSYDTRNSKQKPTQGYMVGGSLALTGIVGQYKSISSSLFASWHESLADDVVLNVRGSVARISPVSGTKLRLSDNFFAGGETDIRGFKSTGIGPRVRSTKEALGGRTKLKGSVSVNFPTGLPRHVGLNFLTFVDAGTVLDHGFDNSTGLVIDKSNSLRVSVGLGLQFDSIIPLSIIFAKPVKKETWDRTESFVLSLGANF